MPPPIVSTACLRRHESGATSDQKQRNSLSTSYTSTIQTTTSSTTYTKLRTARISAGPGQSSAPIARLSPSFAGLGPAIREILRGSYEGNVLGNRFRARFRLERNGFRVGLPRKLIYRAPTKRRTCPRTSFLIKIFIRILNDFATWVKKRRFAWGGG